MSVLLYILCELDAIRYNSSKCAYSRNDREAKWAGQEVGL